MINVEFRLTMSHNRDSDKMIYKDKWPTAPIVGELVNLNGDPYIITERGWAASNDLGVDQIDNLYCYFRVSPYQYGQKIG